MCDKLPIAYLYSATNLVYLTDVMINPTKYKGSLIATLPLRLSESMLLSFGGR